MHSDLIGKIEKARRYAQEPDRIEISEFKASVRGDNDTTHHVELRAGEWKCTCSFSRIWGTCAHIMAAQRILNPMLSEQASAAHLAVDYKEAYEENAVLT